MISEFFCWLFSIIYFLFWSLYFWNGSQNNYIFFNLRLGIFILPTIWWDNWETLNFIWNRNQLLMRVLHLRSVIFRKNCSLFAEYFKEIHNFLSAQVIYHSRSISFHSKRELRNGNVQPATFDYNFIARTVQFRHCRSVTHI